MKSSNTTPIALSLLLATALLAACGSGQSPSSSAAANRAAAASLPDNASADEVAAHMRGDVHCPAAIKTPPQAAGTPVDDVRGVRPGLTYEEAANVVMCTNPMLVVTPADDRGFQIKPYGQKIRQGFTARFAEPGKTGQQIMEEMRREQQARMANAVQHDLKPGEEKWFVSTMGVPGQERVIGVAREEWFATGKNPTVESITAALVKKYGKPTQTVDEHRSGQLWDRHLHWDYDPRGRLITETSSLYTSCRGVADPDRGFGLSANCGVAVTAHIIPMRRSNTALAQALQVGAVDQAAGYTLLASTEAGLKAMDAARRAREVKQAAKNADATQL